MTDEEKTEQIGVLIRQLRRQRNISQTQLGAPHYSKSYISGIEKNSIRPSPKALEFFARQLSLPGDYFTVLLVQPASINQQASLKESEAISEQLIKDKKLLQLLLLQDRTDLNVLALEGLLLPGPELFATLSPPEQGSYFFLEGVIAQGKQQYDGALAAFERALPLVSEQLRPAVLDALGQHYYEMRSSATALSYHLRALTLLRHAHSPQPEQTQLFTIALHCGEDYRLLGSYDQACEMYDLARSHLRAEHDMKSAARLYLGWGYCTYAHSWRMAAQAVATKDLAPLEEMERRFKRAIELTTQGRDLCRLSGDQKGEATARLLLAVAGLDLSAWRMQMSRGGGATSPDSYLLEDAEEQCRQVLAFWQDTPTHAVASAVPDDGTLDVALGFLARIFIQRAKLARWMGNEEMARRERAFATHIYQRALDALREPVFPQAILQPILTLQAEQEEDGRPALSGLPDPPDDAPASPSRLPGWVEVFRAAGEVVEELGRTATSPVDASNCYKFADRCFQTALTLAGRLISSQEREPGYLVRHHQYYALLLLERSTFAPNMSSAVNRKLAAQLTDGLSQMQDAIISK